MTQVAAASSEPLKPAEQEASWGDAGATVGTLMKAMPEIVAKEILHER